MLDKNYVFCRGLDSVPSALIIVFPDLAFAQPDIRLNMFFVAYCVEQEAFSIFVRYPQSLAGYTRLKKPVFQTGNVFLTLSKILLFKIVFTFWKLLFQKSMKCRFREVSV